MVTATLTDNEAAAKALKAISRGKTGLVMDARNHLVFFATLALRLPVTVDEKIPTMAVDGRNLFINPAFTLSLHPEELKGVLAHEVLHIALKHHCRRGHRQPFLWNLAADLAINDLLKEAGLRLPKCGIFPGVAPFQSMPAGKSAEWYYDKILEEAIPIGQLGSSGDGGGCGQVLDAAGAKTASDFEEAARESDMNTAQAHQLASRAGTLPGGMDRVVAELLRPKVNWAETLRRFVTRISRNDFSWSHPNRRFIGQGIYFPGLRSEELGHVVALVDTSGSISGQILNRFASELEGILQAYDCDLTIVYHDSQVAGTQTWKSSDGQLKMTPMGGGGTDHRPAFAWINENIQDVVCCVSLTDLFTVLPEEVPGYPVLWGVVGNNEPKAHFGEIMLVE